jgi:hypothetical protein
MKQGELMKDFKSVDGPELSRALNGTPKLEAEEPQEKVNGEKSNGKKKTSK